MKVAKNLLPHEKVKIHKNQIVYRTERAYLLSFPETSKYKDLLMVVPLTNCRQSKEDENMLEVIIFENPSFKGRMDKKEIVREIS